MRRASLLAVDVAFKGRSICGIEDVSDLPGAPTLKKTIADGELDAKTMQ
jgi:hypothetical protein